MQDRLGSLERSVRRLQRYAAVVTVVLVLLLLAAARAPDDEPGILRARGLVIVDAAGRERILLGAPIPPAANRVRTDPDRVREIWGPRFPPEYLEHYAGYEHATNGLVVLDEKGFDRIVLGDPVPDPNVGRRIGPSTGLALNDEQGFERTGYGLVTTDGGGRVTLGLDAADGSEGAALTVFDDGHAGLFVRERERLLWLGAAPAGSPFTGLDEPLHGLLMRRGDEREHLLNVAGGDG